MRLLLGLALLAGLACAWWLGVAQMVRGLPTSHQAGAVQAQSIAVSGFPQRFDLAIARPALPARGWSAERVDLSAPSYWPLRASGAVIGPQTFVHQGQTWRLDGPDMPLDLSLAPDTALRTASLHARQITVAGPLAGRLDALVLTVRATDRPQALEIALDLDGLALETLPEAALQLRATLDFDSPPRLIARPAWRNILFRDTRLELGSIRVGLEGALARDPGGAVAGELTLNVTDWQALLTLAQARGLVPAEQAPMIAMMAQGMIRDAGDSLTLPLSVRASVVYLGPLALLDLRDL